MKQILLKKGKALVEDVHSPALGSNEILIRVMSSCLSVGTELQSLNEGKKSLFKRVFENPDKVLRILDIIEKNGIYGGIRKVKGKLNEYKATGYSASGIIIGIGNDIKGFDVGDKVACAGGGYAYHSELITVPKNLVVKIPNNVSFEEASSVALGAISLQGVRRLSPTLGECIAVIGLGFIGQITSQLLIQNGCRVVAIDIDKSRLDVAKANGAWKVFLPDEISNPSKFLGDKYPYGVDGVIITAASSSDEIISNAFSICRKKGKVVIVGDIGLNLNREDFYTKEIDVLISSSYGPGRYDSCYEERSIEYPLPYVRWTENRNMSEYLELINEDRLRLELLLKHIVKIDDATKAFDSNKLNENFPHFTTIIKYFHEDVEPKNIKTKSESINVSEISKTTKHLDKINIAVVGLGNFAKLVVLPNLIKHSKNSQIKALISKNGVTAKNISNEMNLDVLRTSNFDDILNNDLVNTVFILTRHNLHYEILKKALNDGKNIYIEKPTVINKEQLLELNQIVSKLGDDCPIIHTGYNRRFSPHIIFSKEKLEQRSSPLLINIRINAGYIDENHWVHSEEGGGRNIGEGCHFYDLMCFLTNSKVKEVSVICISNSSENANSPDNFIVTLKFEDGSIGSITYTSQGSNKISKEYIEMFFDNKTIIIDDFTVTNYYDNSHKIFKTSIQDKGHENQIKSFLDSIKTGKRLIPFNEQFHAADISFCVEKYLK